MSARSVAGQQALYHAAGWIYLAFELPEAVAGPVRTLARELVQKRPLQDLLSGVHNPFGHHACTGEAWRFLDLAESPALLDAVETVLGPDLVLWDSELYVERTNWQRDEAQYWPVEPLAGTVAALDLESGRSVLIDIARLAETFDTIPLPAGSCYTLRYMPATSLYNRDPRFGPNRRATGIRPLVNYRIRPIWLVRGTDRAGSNFATGFAPPAARWAQADPRPAAP